MSDQEIDKSLSEPLVGDDEFKALMEGAELEGLDPQSEKILQRAQERIESDLPADSVVLEPDQKSWWQGVVPNLREMSYRNFLMAAAACSLVLGLGLSLYMSPEKDYEGIKGDEILNIPVEISVFSLSESGEKNNLNEDEMTIGMTVGASVYAEKEGFYAFLVFRDGARLITTNVNAIKPHDDVEVMIGDSDLMQIKTQESGVTLDFCVLVASTQSQIRALLNAAVTKDEVLAAGRCQEFEVKSS